MRGEEKHKKSFRFKNYSKFFFSANELPFIYDVSQGFFSRWVLFEFRYQFVDDPNPLNEYEQQRNPYIEDELLTDAELSGLLNWALFHGLDRLRAKGKFSESPANKEIEHRWLLQADSLRAFVNDVIERGVRNIQRSCNSIRKDLFYNVYQDWCEENGTMPIKKETVGQTITRDY